MRDCVVWAASRSETPISEACASAECLGRTRKAKTKYSARSAGAGAAQAETDIYDKFIAHYFHKFIANYL